MTIEELYTKCSEALSEYLKDNATKGDLPADYVPLYKYLHSKNITIEDWNTLVKYVESTLASDTTFDKNIRTLYELLSTTLQTAASKEYVGKAMESAVNEASKNASDMVTAAFNNLDSKKVDKIPASVKLGSIVYSRSAGGVEEGLNYRSTTQWGSDLVYRDENGRSEIKDPINDLHIANKHYVDTTINQKLASTYVYKGSVQTFADLPTDVNIGDVYNVIEAYQNYPAGTNFAWTGTQWDALGGSVDLSNYPTKQEVASDLSKKLNKVSTAGTSNRLYAIAPNGSQYVVKATNSVVSGENTVPIRDASGNFKVGTPKVSGDATNKGYVDSKIDSEIASVAEAQNFINQTNGVATIIANTHTKSLNLAYARCFTGDGVNYIVSGNTLYKLNSDGSLDVVLDTILTDSSAKNAENITMDYYNGTFIIAYRLLWDKYLCCIKFITIKNGAVDKWYDNTIDNVGNSYEPFIYREDNVVYFIYCNESIDKSYQDIKCKKYTILDNWKFESSTTFTLLEHGLSKDINGNTHSNERPGFPCVQRLIDGSLIMFYETTVNKLLGYPITINYLYFPNNKIEALERNKFTGGTLVKFKDKPCTAPYISVKEDGRINLTFHSNYGYYGLDADIGIHEKVFYYYISNKFVEKNQVLKLNDFTNLPIDSVVKDKWIGGWGSNFTMVDGRTCIVYTKGHNTSASTSVSDGSVILTLDTTNYINDKLSTKADKKDSHDFLYGFPPSFANDSIRDESPYSEHIFLTDEESKKLSKVSLIYAYSRLKRKIKGSHTYKSGVNTKYNNRLFQSQIDIPFTDGSDRIGVYFTINNVLEAIFGQYTSRELYYSLWDVDENGQPYVDWCKKSDGSHTGKFLPYTFNGKTLHLVYLFRHVIKQQNPYYVSVYQYTEQKSGNNYVSFSNKLSDCVKKDIQLEIEKGYGFTLQIKFVKNYKDDIGDGDDAKGLGWRGTMANLYLNLSIYVTQTDTAYNYLVCPTLLNFRKPMKG